ncbi:MAG TPA: Hsp20/alpha crystallin family protein [Thermoanaerobaculia bacterium]|nr:Hsp20/alpha crystallin family protein [Thermoanaerobaculia bacterium]
MVDLVSWDPYREFRNLARRFDRAFSPAPSRDEEVSLGSWMPPVDIAEDKDRITLTAELPGFRQDQIEIQMEGGVLTLRGERRFEDASDGKNFHRVERSYGQFVRSFTLPNNVDRERIQASFSDGLLEISMPKREDAKPRQIKISAVAETKGSEKKTVDVKAR